MQARVDCHGPMTVSHHEGDLLSDRNGSAGMGHSDGDFVNVGFIHDLMVDLSHYLPPLNGVKFPKKWITV